MKEKAREERTKDGTCRATTAELAGVDRGLKAAREGRFSTSEQVEAMFSKHRDK